MDFILIQLPLPGRVGIVLNSRWFESKDNKTENIDAAERAMQFMLGWFANPIFGSGDYPLIMKQKVFLPQISIYYKGIARGFIMIIDDYI